jgi:hypothetical protein
MPFNISTFKNNGLVYGGARPALFSVILSVPTGINISNVSVQKFTFVCKSAELPSFTVGDVKANYFGRAIKLAGDRTFEDWDVSVMNDEDFSVRALFEAWSNAINRLVSNVRDPNLATEEYKTDLVVIQYAKDGTEIRSYKIVGAWPSKIGAIALDWDSQNQFESFPVTFCYDYFEPLLETSNKKAGGVNVYGGQTKVDGPSGP